MEIEEIKRIINLKRESIFGDFKRKPYSDNGDFGTSHQRFRLTLIIQADSLSA